MKILSFSFIFLIFSLKDSNIFIKASFELVKNNDNYTSSYYCVDSIPPSIDKDKDDVIINEYFTKSECDWNATSLLMFKNEEDLFFLNRNFSLSTSRCFVHELFYSYSVIPVGTRFITHRVAFIEGYSSKNPGHLLVDAYAGTINSQYELGLQISKDFQLISINGIFPGENIEPKFQSGFSDYPMDTIENIYNQFKLWDIHNKSVDNDLLCFKEVVIGGNKLFYGHNVNTISLLSTRSFMLNNWNLIDNIEFKDHLIVIFNKPKGYGFDENGKYIGQGGWIENIEEIEIEMKKEFGSTRIIIESFSSLLGDEQASLMLKTTVFITPGGGGSFSAIFLNNRAAILVLDTINTTTSESIPLFDWELKLWNKLPNLHLFRYDINPNEYFEDSRMNKGENRFERGYYNLDILKLIYNTKMAMKYVERDNPYLNNCHDNNNINS